MEYKVDIRWHNGKLSHRTVTASARVAEFAFRELLADPTFQGEPCAARVVSPVTGRSIYFSAFDRPEQIHPQAPLDLARVDDGSPQAMAWQPLSYTAAMPNTGNFAQDLRAWMKAANITSAEAASVLGTSKASVDNWLQGRSAPRHEAALRARAGG